MVCEEQLEKNVLVCRVDVGWLLVLHGSCTSFSYGLLLRLVSSCAAPQDFGLIPKWHELSFLIFAIDQKCCVSHFVQYNSNLSCSAIIKLIFFVNVRFFRNYMFEMSKFKKLQRREKYKNWWKPMSFPTSSQSIGVRYPILTT